MICHGQDTQVDRNVMNDTDCSNEQCLSQALVGTLRLYLPIILYIPHPNIGYQG